MTDCYNQALNMLVRREYSQRELTQKLKFKNFKDIEIITVIAKLQQQKYQSDERFCENIINTRIKQGKGRMIIEQELKKNKIVDFNLNEIDFYALCQQVKIKKFGVQKYQNNKEKSRQMHFLQSRGFNFDEINNSL